MTRLTGHDFKDIHPVQCAPASSGTGLIPPTQQALVVDGLEMAQHQEGYPNDPSAHAIEVGQPLSQMPEPGNSWPDDLGPEDLNWIFQDSLGNFSLYDFSLQNETGSAAF